MRRDADVVRILIELRCYPAAVKLDSIFMQELNRYNVCKPLWTEPGTGARAQSSVGSERDEASAVPLCGLRRGSSPHF